MINFIRNNLENLKTKINEITNLSSCDLTSPSQITFVAVSKFQPAESIEEAYNCGVRDFGENYIQEWQKKCAQLSHLKDIRWHIIGPLQRNKVKFLNKNVHCLQSLDSLTLAKEIDKKWLFVRPLNVLVQLQVDKNDKNKSGISFEEAEEICKFIAQSKKLNLCGFMGIGPNIQDEEKLTLLYSEFVIHCHNLWSHFAPNKTQKAIISLGMSSDLAIALKCGSNMVRVGTALFGSRNNSSL